MNPMPAPRFTVEIGESTWTIKLVPRVPRFGEPRSKGPLLGITHFASKTIYIGKKQSAESALTTLCHEYGHAFEDEYDIDIPHELIYLVSPMISRLLLANYL